MINPKNFINFLKKNDINFFCGVPDSVLKSFSSQIEKEKNNYITANEGTAISLGAGYHLATRKMPCIYMQNSGLGNSVNPLTSLSHKKVFSLPSLILIGWRGSPNSKDEPQHEIKGSITRELLDLIGIKYHILKKKDDYKNLKNLINYGKKNSLPVACLIKKNIFKDNLIKKSNQKKNNKGIDRKEFISNLLKSIKTKTYIISSTGYTSREHFEVAEQINNKNIKNFYMVGSMGHTNSLALGFSIYQNSDVICLDGDGSLIMHLGSMLITSIFKKRNFKYFLLNNNMHESVGNQTTNAKHINFEIFFKSFGIKNYYKISKIEDFKKINMILNKKDSCFVEISTKKSNNNKLKRPKDLNKIKNFFIQ